MSERDPEQGVYGISVAAELTGLGVQMLRQYEDRGLLLPQRTEGGTRRYSEADLDRLRRIKELLAGGLNLAGVGMVLDLEEDNEGLRDHNDRLQRENRRLRSTGTS
jgi:MerR family transcriptional regulator, heat shock protein HspR